MALRFLVAREMTSLKRELGFLLSLVRDGLRGRFDGVRIAEVVVADWLEVILQLIYQWYFPLGC